MSTPEQAPTLQEQMDAYTLGLEHHEYNCPYTKTPDWNRSIRLLPLYHAYRTGWYQGIEHRKLTDALTDLTGTTKWNQ